MVYDVMVTMITDGIIHLSMKLVPINTNVGEFNSHTVGGVLDSTSVHGEGRLFLMVLLDGFFHNITEIFLSDVVEIYLWFLLQTY